MITKTDITVWTISALLAVGVGWSRFARWKAREKMVRELIAMKPERRTLFLDRLDPKLALQMREELLKRFNILS